MRALITGASSGIGRDLARVLSKKGYDLILVARRRERLEDLKEELMTNVSIISLDLKEEDNVYKLYNDVKDKSIDILINNAGFGIRGNFNEVSLEKELNMIDVNIKTVHILTKLFLNDFIKKNNGYILNISSIAGFLPGPLMSSYYASKSYILRLTEGIYEELKKNHSKVYIGVVCPGPVNTEFEKVAKVKFKTKHQNSMSVAEYSINKMFKKKLLIIPGLDMKLFHIFYRFIPTKILMKFMYKIQNNKYKL